MSLKEINSFMTEIGAHLACAIQVALACALHDQARVGNSPKGAQVVAHVADCHGHWNRDPMCAFLLLIGDAISVEKEAGEIYKTMILI